MITVAAYISPDLRQKQHEVVEKQAKLCKNWRKKVKCGDHQMKGYLWIIVVEGFEHSRLAQLFSLTWLTMGPPLRSLPARGEFWEDLADEVGILPCGYRFWQVDPLEEPLNNWLIVVRYQAPLK
jgi:hypothetical protein